MNYLPLLKQFPTFRSVPDEQLQWLADRVSEETYPAETILHNAGDPVDHLMLLVDGQVRVENGGDEIIDYEPTSTMDTLPFSRMKTATNLTITTDVIRELLLHRDQFRALTTQCYELTEALVQQMTIRVRDFTRLIQQADKLASLGRLLAGLAYELNKPVSAIMRRANALEQPVQTRLECLVLKNAQTHEQQEVSTGGSLIFIGAKPYTDWIEMDIIKDGQGFIETGRDLNKYNEFKKFWKLNREPFAPETYSVGIFAAGDLRSGAMNCVASAVGEGAVAVNFVHK